MRRIVERIGENPLMGHFPSGLLISISLTDKIFSGGRREGVTTLVTRGKNV